MTARALAAVNRHFADRDPVVRQIYDRIVHAAASLGAVRQDPKKTSIHLARQSAFAGIAPRKKGLVLTFKSARDIKSPRIAKRQQLSANRWYLDVPLQDPAQVDDELRVWLKESIELTEIRRRTSS
jgi:Domain of unknown function (DUF5655)